MGEDLERHLKGPLMNFLPSGCEECGQPRALSVHSLQGLPLLQSAALLRVPPSPGLLASNDTEEGDSKLWAFWVALSPTALGH